MAITIPNVFVAGTRIESAPVNANFAAMTNALDKTGDTLTGNLVVGTGITIDGLDISTVPQSGGVFNPGAIVFSNIIVGAATTAGIRLDLESGTLAVREGDDSAYGPMLASVYNVPTGGSINFNAGSAALTWDTTESTANLALSANVDYKLGAQELVRCVNRTGTAIAKGKAVYIVGAHGNRPEIALADASVEATASTTLGITAESIADTAEGFVCVSGMLRGLDTNSLTEGQIVWLSETAGELTSTRPTQPAHGVFMGLCVRQQPGTSGILYISVVNGLELDELHDVLITTPTANQILKRNSGNTLWINSSGTALTKTDDTNVTLTLGGSASTALVNAASLTLGWTGQLAVGRGGTGASTLTGYVKGSGTAALTASSTIPNTDITGLGTLSTQNASSVSISGGSITGITDLAIADGGTGASTAQGAINALAGAVTSGQYLRGNGTNVVMSAIQAADVPTLNQNTTGTAANVTGVVAAVNGGTGQSSYAVGDLLYASTTTALAKLADVATGNALISGGVGVAPAWGKIGLTTHVSGTLALANGGTGQTTAQAAINSLAGATTSGQYLRGNGTNVVMSAIQAGDVPTLNQNTTGTAAGLSATLAVSSGGTGQTSYTDGQLLIGNTATTSLTKATLTAGSGVTITNGNGTITIAATGSGGTVTSVGATSPVASSGGTTPTISLNSAYGDTLNPYGSKTANFVLAAPNGTAGVPSFRALVAADIPTLNQNTTGTAAGLSSTLAVSSGGTGQTTYTDGQLLIGNTVGNTLTKATLTAGSGISITNGNGSITIANTGGSGTVTSVSGTGTANGLSLSGTVTTTGSLTLSGTVNSMEASAGTVTAPSIAASGDLNTGIYFPAADTLSVTTGGVERLRFTSGTALVIGSGEGTATVAAQTFRGAAAAGTNIAGANLTIEPSNGTGTGGSGAIIFRTAPATTSGTTVNTLADRVRITNTGDVVLGTGEGTTSVTAGTIRGANLAGTNLTASSPLILRAGLGTGTGSSHSIFAQLGVNGASGTTQNTARTVMRLTHQGPVFSPSNSDMDSPPVGGAFVSDVPGGNGGVAYLYANMGTNQTGSLSHVVRAIVNGAVRQLWSGIEYSNGGGISAVIQTQSNDALSIRINQGNPNVSLQENIRFLTTQDNGMQTGKKLYMDGCAGTGDTFIVESSANILTLAHGTGGAIQIGPGNASAAPGATALKAPSGTGTNIAGANLTIEPGNGTGTGGSGAVIINTAATGTSGTTANTMVEAFRVDRDGNVGVNVSSFGTSAKGVLGLKNGTKPTTGPADTIQIYSVDRSAGNTIPAIYTEGSGVTDAGITSTTVTHKIAIEVNGTVYYLLATTNAT